MRLADIWFLLYLATSRYYRQEYHLRKRANTFDMGDRIRIETLGPSRYVQEREWGMLVVAAVLARNELKSCPNVHMITDEPDRVKAPHIFRLAHHSDLDSSLHTPHRFQQSTSISSNRAECKNRRKKATTRTMVHC